jgi:TonB family protein
MTRPSTALAGALLFLAAASAGAQERWPECAKSGLGCGIVANSTAAPLMVVPAERAGYRPVVAVRAGTALQLELRDDLAGRATPLRAGERIRLAVAEPVRGRTLKLVEHPGSSGGLELGETVGSDGPVLVPRGSPALAEIVEVRSGGRIALRLLFVRAGGRDVRLRGQASLEPLPGALVTAVLDEDIVPAQALVPLMVPDFSRARIATAADLAAAPKPPPPPPAPTIAEPARPRAEAASYIGAADYPLSALQAREEGRVAYSLDVGADGRVAGCAIRRSSGSSALDAATCRLMRSRARFTPARDTNGNPAASQVVQEMVWELPSSR